MARKTPALACRRANLIRAMVSATCETPSSPAPLSASAQEAAAERSRLQAAIDKFAGWTR